MAATLAEQLASVQAMIAKIEAGAQSVTAEDGRSVTRPNLQALYDREKQLLRRVDYESTHGKTLAEF